MWILSLLFLFLLGIARGTPQDLDLTGNPNKSKPHSSGSEIWSHNESLTRTLLGPPYLVMGRVTSTEQTPETLLETVLSPGNGVITLEVNTKTCPILF